MNDFWMGALLFGWLPWVILMFFFVAKELSEVGVQRELLRPWWEGLVRVLLFIILAPVMALYLTYRYVSE